MSCRRARVLSPTGPAAIGSARWQHARHRQPSHVVATWCHRSNSTDSFSRSDLKRLEYLEGEWTHPHFISIENYADHMTNTGVLENVHTEDWWEQTIASWRHSIWVGVYDPWPVVRRPWTW